MLEKIKTKLKDPVLHHEVKEVVRQVGSSIAFGIAVSIGTAVVIEGTKAVINDFTNALHKDQ